ATADTKGETSVDTAPTGSAPVAEPEFHVTFVDSALPPVSLFRQIRERLREPKITVPKEYYRNKGTPDATPPGSSSVPGAEFHPTFVESILPPVSLFRQVLQELHEPKFKVPEKYLQGKTSLPAADLPPPVWEDPNQLALPFEKLRGPVPINSWRTSVPEPEYHLVMVVDPEAIKWRRRT